MPENEAVSAVKPTFEQSLDELEALVKNLESGELTLEGALQVFERGIGLSEVCRKQLEEAESRIEVLIKKDGKLQPEPFRPER